MPGTSVMIEEIAPDLTAVQVRRLLRSIGRHQGLMLTAAAGLRSPLDRPAAPRRRGDRPGGPAPRPATGPRAREVQSPAAPPNARWTTASARRAGPPVQGRHGRGGEAAALDASFGGTPGPAVPDSP